MMRFIVLYSDRPHFGIALCRRLSIPTRRVVGYLYGLQHMDLRAWFEADVDIYNQFGPSLACSRQQIRVGLVAAPGAAGR